MVAESLNIQSRDINLAFLTATCLNPEVVADGTFFTSLPSGVDETRLAAPRAPRLDEEDEEDEDEDKDNGWEE